MDKFLRLAKDDYAKGIATFNSCDKAGSIPYFTRHLEAFPDHYNARRMRARAYGIVGQDANCLADLHILKERSSGAQRLAAEVEILANGEVICEEFFALLQKLINTYPHHAAGWDFLALCFLRKAERDDDETLKALHKVVEVAEQYDQTDMPGYPWDYTFLGDVYSRKKDWDEAQKCYQTAIRAAGTLTVAHIGLGRVYLEKNDQRKARRCYHTARELNPKLVHWETFEAFMREVLGGNDESDTNDKPVEIKKKSAPDASVVTFSARQADTAAAQNESDELQEMLRAWIPKKRKAKKCAKDYEQIINERFRKLLERISNNESATRDEQEKVWEYVQNYADDDWKDTFLSRLNHPNYTFHLARVFSILINNVQEYQGGNEEEKKRKLNITVISHGGIDVNVSIPCSFYYPNSWLTKVTLYEPWGCAIVASVVYGITTNTIETDQVWYTGEVRPSKPSSWNVLPRNLDETPNITLTPVKIGEPAFEDLMRLFHVLQGTSDGLVIPYFTGPGNDLLPFPEIPFWVLCNAFALIAAMLKIEITIRLAACLAVSDRSTVTGHVPCSQYCTVDGTANPPVRMFSSMGLSPVLERQLNKLNEFL